MHPSLCIFMHPSVCTLMHPSLCTLMRRAVRTCSSERSLPSSCSYRRSSVRESTSSLTTGRLRIACAGAGRGVRGPLHVPLLAPVSPPPSPQPQPPPPTTSSPPPPPSGARHVMITLARCANLSVERLSPNAISAGETAAITVVLQLPPRESASSRVSLLSRYGTCTMSGGAAAP